MSTGEGGVYVLFQLVSNKISSSGLRLLVIIVSMLGVSLLVADGVLTPAVRWAWVRLSHRRVILYVIFIPVSYHVVNMCVVQVVFVVSCVYMLVGDAVLTLTVTCVYLLCC